MARTRRTRIFSLSARSLTFRLMLLIGATTIPLSLLSAFMLYSEYSSNRATAERQLVAQAQTITRLVDREVERAQAIARASATSTALARGDLETFRRELVAASNAYDEDLPPGAQSTVMRLADLDGHWKVGTVSDTAADRHPPRDYVLEAIASRRAQVSNLYTGLRSGQPRVSVAVPVFADPAPGETSRRLTGAIAMAISRERFIQIVREIGLPPGAVASIQDRGGFTIARSARDAETVGRLPAPIVLRAIVEKDAGLAPGGTVTLDGVPSTIAFAHAPRSGFIVKLDVPETIFLAPLRASLARTVAVGVLVLAIGLALSALLARRLVLALRRVVPEAQEAARGDTVPASIGLLEADEVATELTRVLIGQREAAAALIASEAKLRTLADALPQMVWSADPDGSYDYFNARCHSFAGVATLDAETWGRLLHPDDRAALAERWQRGRETEEPFELEGRARRHDGECRWMLIRAIPIREADHEDKLIRWFGSWTDITDLVEARELAARGRAELEALVEERTKDLIETQTRLAHAARMEALGQLAGGIAHDFNNVLQAVLGGGALIERQCHDPVLVAKHARTVLDSAERGAAITSRLLAFSHRNDRCAESVDTDRLLSDIHAILSHTLGAALRIEIVAQPGLPPLLTDKSQLETVLVNLAANARDAMGGRGTIVLRAFAEKVAETVAGHPDGLLPGVYVRLSVTDTGTGMDAATLQRVTEPFFTTKSAGKGTGLGLAMARGFATKSGGALRIESVPDQGTTVKLWLPAATCPPEATAPSEPAASNRKPPPARLLVVDDERRVRAVVKETLEMEGYDVLEASSGEQGLALLQTHAVDVLISDLSMPGMDGLTLIRLAQAQRPGLPAILVTGLAREEVDAIGSAPDRFAVLRKPVTSAQLCARVAAFLETGLTSPKRALDPPLRSG